MLRECAPLFENCEVLCSNECICSTLLIILEVGSLLCSGLFSLCWEFIHPALINHDTKYFQTRVFVIIQALHHLWDVYNLYSISPCMVMIIFFGHKMWFCLFPLICTTYLPIGQFLV